MKSPTHVVSLNWLCTQLFDHARLRQLCTSMLIGLLFVSQPSNAQRVSLVDRVVAVVNSEVVTLSELNERVAMAERQLRRQNTPLPDRENLQRQALERLILERVQIQSAQDLGLRVDESQLDRAVARIAEQNNLTLSAFRVTLEKDGVRFDRFREEIRNEIMLSRLRQREVDDKIEISESEIDLYFAELKSAEGSGATNLEYNLAHILVRLPDQASPEVIERARAKAAKAIADARGGADFAKLAAGLSDAPDALSGGEMGWRAADRLPELFATALRSMQTGQVSEVLRSPAGFHVLKIIDRRGGGVGALAERVQQTRVRHILIKTSEIVSENDAKRRLADLRERIVTGGMKFGDLARLHSEDGSAARGGELDWLYPGDTVPDFERAMNDLKPGTVSQPVKSPFGWHLIEVQERRVAEVSEDRRRMQARMALRERRADEAFQDWLRQIRDRAYVEIRLEER